MQLNREFEPPTLEYTWSAMQFIPAHERETWLNVLASLKSEFTDDAYSIADEWSQRAGNYNDKDFRSVWKSIKPSRITINTLFYLARQNGWKPGSDSIPDLPSSKPPPEAAQAPTRAYAPKLWLSADRNDSAVTSHLYAQNKGIDSAGGAGRGIASGSKIGLRADCLIVPIRERGIGKVVGVQCINPEGVKQTFGTLSGAYLLLGNTLDKSLIWYVCEGWASAYSMVFHIDGGNGACACSFGKSNQRKCAELIADHHNPGEIVILWEDDS